MIRTPLPRSTDEILQKKDFVLEKIRLQAPNLYPHAAEIIKNQPEMLDEFLAGAIVKFPFIFEKDKYNRVNGKIIDPMLQEKARKDITRKQGISNTEKVAMYHRLNITNGEYDG
jgi:competence protein ComGF